MEWFFLNPFSFIFIRTLNIINNNREFVWMIWTILSTSYDQLINVFYITCDRSATTGLLIETLVPRSGVKSAALTFK